MSSFSTSLPGNCWARVEIEKYQLSAQCPTLYYIAMVGLSSENTAVIISVLRHVCMVSQAREQKSVSRSALRIAFLENESESRRFLRAHKISSCLFRPTFLLHKNVAHTHGCKLFERFDSLSTLGFPTEDSILVNLFILGS